MKIKEGTAMVPDKKKLHNLVTSKIAKHFYKSKPEDDLWSNYFTSSKGMVAESR